MPTNRQRRRQPRRSSGRRSKLTAGLEFCFEADDDPMGELGVDLSAAEIAVKLSELWKIHSAEFLAKFIVEHPGERPATWWRCSAPEPRPEIVWEGGSPGGDPYLADRALRRARELEILIRRGLLTPDERVFVEKNPALLLPLEHELGGE